jgi:hypothetical protein
MKTKIDWVLGAGCSRSGCDAQWGRVDAGDCADWSVPVSGVRETVEERPQHLPSSDSGPADAGQTGDPPYVNPTVPMSESAL